MIYVIGLYAVSFVVIALCLLEERGKPAHTHEEGNGTPDCPRCGENS